VDKGLITSYRLVMSTISVFNAFNLGSFKDEESGQVALYHYLKNFYHEESQLTPEVINRFFADCLQLPYWQEKRVELYNDILDALKRFFVQAGGSQFTFNQLIDISKIQLISISNPENLFATIQSFEKNMLKEGETLRVLLDGENRALIIKRFYNGDVTVRTYSNLARLASNTILPLTHDQELLYDSNLELRPNATQLLKTAPHSQVRFQIRRESVTAQFISGFAFRLNQSANFASLSQEPRLFYPLKRLERYYINRSTDPFYVELISTISKAVQMAGNPSDDALAFARQAFEGGQIAFDQIFPDDKALYSRLRELAKLVSVRF
jgi:hypothetical protein